MVHLDVELVAAIQLSQGAAKNRAIFATRPHAIEPRVKGKDLGTVYRGRAVLFKDGTGNQSGRVEPELGPPLLVEFFDGPDTGFIPGVGITEVRPPLGNDDLALTAACANLVVAEGDEVYLPFPVLIGNSAETEVIKGLIWRARRVEQESTDYRAG